MKVAVSNASVTAIPVWIEPWCDEMLLPPRSTLTFEPAGDEEMLPEVEVVDERLIIWAGGPGTAVVTIDDVRQDTGSAIIALPPELFALPVKSTMMTLFGRFPQARLGGTTVRRPWWRRLFGL